MSALEWQLVIIACWTALNASFTWAAFRQLLEIKHILLRMERNRKRG